MRLAWKLPVVMGLLASPLAAQDADEGARLYQQHCATCHGAEATGDGPMAAALILQPPDLTALAAGNDGVFPTARVARRIDGRDPLVSHGSPMPVYGGFFEGDGQASIKAETGQPIVAAEQVVALTDYLRELQR